MNRFTQIIILIVAFIFSSACGFLINNDSFDSAKWKSGDARAKGKMSYDLQNSKVLIGKTKAEVDELLGKDDYPSLNSRVYEINTNVPTDIYFSVHFDETAQVSSTDIGD